MYYNNNYYGQPQTIMYPQYYPQQPIQPIQQSNMNMSVNNTIPLILVNGVEEAKRYLCNINSTIYLKDTNSSLLFEKTCDSQGHTTMRSYELKEVSISENNQIVDKPQVAYKKDLDELYSKIEELIKGKVDDHNV